TTDDGPIAGSQIRLPGLPRGAVIVLCAPGDLADGGRETMNRLAEHGYETLAADLSSVPDDAQAVAQVRALLEHLTSWGWSGEEVGLVGYAEGGRVALRAAAETVLGAAISISPVGV